MTDQKLTKRSDVLDLGPGFDAKKAEEWKRLWDCVPQDVKFKAIGLLAHLTAPLAILGKQSIDTALEADRLTRTLEGLAGGADEAATYIDAIKEASQGTIPQVDALAIAIKNASQGAISQVDALAIANCASSFGVVENADDIPNYEIPVPGFAYLDGRDPDAKPPLTVMRINLWNSIKRSRVVGRLRHGQRVLVLERVWNLFEERHYYLVRRWWARGWVSEPFLSAERMEAIGERYESGGFVVSHRFGVPVVKEKE